MACSGEIACMCSFCLVPSFVFKVLITYDLRMENTKLTATVIGKGGREKRI